MYKYRPWGHFFSESGHSHPQHHPWNVQSCVEGHFHLLRSYTHSVCHCPLKKNNYTTDTTLRTSDLCIWILTTGSALKATRQATSFWLWVNGKPYFFISAQVLCTQDFMVKNVRALRTLYLPQSWIRFVLDQTTHTAGVYPGYRVFLLLTPDGMLVHHRVTSQL